MLSAATGGESCMVPHCFKHLCGHGLLSLNLAEDNVYGSLEVEKQYRYNNNNNNILFLYTLSREETLFKCVYSGTSLICRLRTL